MGVNEELSQIFREEGTEFIEALIAQIEVLSTAEGQDLKAAVERVLRLAHNLKGAATTAGFKTVETLAHAFEGMLGREKESAGPLSKEVLDCAVDVLEVMQAVVDGFDTEAQAQELKDRLAALGGEIIMSSSPADPTVSNGKPRQAAALTGGIGTDGSIRVDTLRLDRLMGSLGELLTFRARLAERHDRQADIYKQLQQLYKSDVGLYGKLEPLVAGLRQLFLNGRKDMLDLSNLTDEVSEAAKHLRTVPLRGATHIWRRIVRESSHICGKNVRLEVSVGQVEIDRYVLERLHDPMMHLLRNAVDHGIESPEERTTALKPAQGLIQVAASLQGAMVRLEVSDDGKGVDWRKARQRAVEKQLITAERADRLTAGQTADLLFRAGFSTSDNVNQISGRGVGLDVVREQLESLSGRAEFASKPALGGTTIVLWVPMSILSSTGLFVRSGRATFALPIESVLRTQRIRADDLTTLDGRTVIKVGEADPVRAIVLGELMGERDSSPSDWLKVVVLTRGGLHLGVVVDEVLGHKEYVTHGLPWNFKHFPGISGAILEADGSVVILIDVVFLFESSHQTGVATQMAPQVVDQRVLVVDDSMSSRTLQRAMLQTAGYEVTLAADGKEAWRLLQTEPFDLLVSDIQMPEMNGIELTRKVRSTANLKDLPVILVTNLARPEDRAAGADAGADDYMVKGTFDQQGLLDIVNKYLGTP